MNRHLALLSLVSAFVTLPATAILDTNENGLSDLWEKQFNSGQLFPENFAQEADDDLDSWTNAQEAAAGTNPFHASAPGGYLRPDTIRVPEHWADTNNDGIIEFFPELIVIEWLAIPGKEYTLLYSLDLADGPWLEFEQPFIGSGTIVTYGYGLAPEVIKFWRVKVEDVDTDDDGLNNWEEYSLGSNPCLEDTSGDGVPDLWLAVHSFAPTQHHGSTLFPGSSLTVVQAFNAGVQARLTATPNDLDGDGLPNLEDADPEDHTVTWLKSPTPAWLLRYPVVPAGYVFLDVSPAGHF